MSAAFDKLRSKLRELFQLDAAAELDFGIYRILNARRVEVEAFLDSLQPQVDAILSQALQSGATELKAELEKAESDLRAMGLDDPAITAVPKIRELREKLANSGGDPTALTHDIFSHLATFFSRYYKDGDFLSLRRYKRDTYAIPYEGEEVKLHWANADQYYIKSAENFRDYRFKLSAAEDAPRVTFKLIEADSQKDNTKPAAGQERRFVYQGIVETGEESHLILGFAYLPLGKENKQADLNKQAIELILKDAAKGPFVTLAAPDPSYTGKKREGRTLLEKHLIDYTARNTFDYFIHKDLGGFLRRELDFYIKNEVLYLDDLDDAPETNWRETRARLKALRTIAGKVIRFLAQIEDFQKKLWLKKKFVTACDYVVTLDRIPEELYPDIAACDAQREEWVRLFAIDEINGDLGRTGYSVPLPMDFLKENQHLSVDSRYFESSFKTRLGVIASVEPASGGVTVKSDCIHAIQLLTKRYASEIKTIYIDPPYNTGDGDFCYKDAYQHSTWMTMIAERLIRLREIMRNDGLLFCSIDRDEDRNLLPLFFGVFGETNFVEEIVWQKSYGGGAKTKLINNLHEYIICFARDKSALPFLSLPPDPAAVKYYKHEDEKVATRGKFRTQPLYTNSNDFRENLTFPLPAPDAELFSQPKRWEKAQRVIATKLKAGTLRLTKVESTKQWQFEECDPQGKWSPWAGMLVHPPKQWQWEWDKTKEALANNELLFSRDDDGVWVVNYKQYRFDEQGEERGKKPGSIMIGPYTQTGTDEVFNRFGREMIKFPKPLGVIEQLLGIGYKDDAAIFGDFFAGSGPVGEIVINLNRDYKGTRKFVLAEMGEHFDTVLIPRLKKVVYSKDWKDGKPQSRNTGVSHCFKVLRLESYEDTLNNLRLHRTRAQELALESMGAEAREEYQLGYMLDLEAAGSQSLLNVSAFTDPFAYTLNIATGTAGETKPATVDLVETFNWLLGLTVLAQGSGGGVTWVEGTNPEGEKVLVLWRNVAEVGADDLNTWCKKQKISVLDGEFALIYVNGDHHLENLRRDDQTWKVRLIDEEFPKLMWEGCE